jgi:hypothetical protein
MCRRSLHGNREISRLAGGEAVSVRIGKARSPIPFVPCGYAESNFRYTQQGSFGFWSFE